MITEAGYVSLVIHGVLASKIPIGSFTSFFPPEIGDMKHVCKHRSTSQAFVDFCGLCFAWRAKLASSPVQAPNGDKHDSYVEFKIENSGQFICARGIRIAEHCLLVLPRLAYPSLEGWVDLRMDITYHVSATSPPTWSSRGKVVVPYCKLNEFARDRRE